MYGREIGWSFVIYDILVEHRYMCKINIYKYIIILWMYCELWKSFNLTTKVNASRNSYNNHNHLCYYYYYYNIKKYYIIYR